MAHKNQQNADTPHAVGLLSARRDRPCRRAPEPRDELISEAAIAVAYPGRGCRGTGYVKDCRWLVIEPKGRLLQCTSRVLADGVEKVPDETAVARRLSN
jgi:hypothetical protein